MASPERLPPVTFRPARGQRNQRLFAGICCVASGILILVLVSAGRAGKNAVALVIAGVGLAVLGCWALAARRVHTTIDAEGVRTSSVVGRRSCRWSDVTDVDMAIDSDGGDPLVWRIKIHRRGGRSFSLPAPTDSSRKDRHDNPDFADQLATIERYWRASTQPPESHQH